jgi:hypothetical protein
MMGNAEDDEFWDKGVELSELAVQTHPKHWRVRLAIAGNDDSWLEDTGIFWESTGYKIGDQIFRGHGYGIEEGPCRTLFDKALFTCLGLESLLFLVNSDPETEKQRSFLPQRLSSPGPRCIADAVQ